MSEDTTRIAVPSVDPGGMDATRSGHFGRCDCFTLVDVTAEGAVGAVTIIDNPPHVDGGCLAPVNLLSSHDVNALIVAGIGARPLAGFREAGIDVYHDDQTPTVSGVLEIITSGGLNPIDPGAVCGGHG